jgi:hypothetical protein
MTADYDLEPRIRTIEILEEVIGMNLKIGTLDVEEIAPLQNEEEGRSVVGNIREDEDVLRLLRAPHLGLHTLIQ